MTDHPAPLPIPTAESFARRVRRVVVGSRNPVKLAAVAAVVRRLAPEADVHGLAVPSGVPDQPWGDDETRRGALARARAALLASGADLAVGLEGGVAEDENGALRTCAWAAAVTRDGRHAFGGSLAMPLPEAVARRVRAGRELGHAVDDAYGLENSKHGPGAVGVLTAGLVDRQGAYEVLVAYALSAIVNRAG